MLLDPRARSPRSDRAAPPSGAPSPAATLTHKLTTFGPAQLDTTELIALLLAPSRSAVKASEAADALAARFRLRDEPAALRSLGAADVCQLSEAARIGRGAAARLAAAMELGRRAAEAQWRCRTRIQCARDIYERMHLRLRDLPQEEMWVVALNVQREIVRETLVTRGVIDSTLAHVRDIFRAAVLENAASICLVHNHPSGEPTPSPEDCLATAKMFAAGRLLGIEVVDHVIIGDGRYYSFHEDRRLGEPEHRPAEGKRRRTRRNRKAALQRKRQAQSSR
jgi:DNA repair protein RadC